MRLLYLTLSFFLQVFFNQASDTGPHIDPWGGATSDEGPSVDPWG